MNRILYAICAVSGLSLALASAICLIKGIDSVASNVAYGVYGLVNAYASFKVWRGAKGKGGQKWTAPKPPSGGAG